MKTLTFVGAAVVCVAIAAGTHFSHQPADIKDFSDVGEKFYSNFNDPNDATALQVAAYNETTGQTDIFKVEFKDGLWRIPSHHDYPADAKDRLARTAASVIGVTRQALVERTISAHKRYQLLDPLDKNVSGTEGRGNRITLYKGDEKLVDFIVGKKADEGGSRYYVRRADEDRFYTADLGKLEVSTKFSDWIEQDVLDINRNDIRELVINRYSVDEVKGRVINEGVLKLSRTELPSSWTMEGLNSETEQVKSSEIDSMLSTLDELKIVGVRRKPEELSAGLKSENGSISIDPLIQMDLQEKGFFIARGGFVSNEGEVNVGTNQGVMYILGFGEEFSGTDVDIEVGGKHPDAKTDAKDESATNPEKKDETTPEKDLKKSRYLFVTVQFDKQLLGTPPVPPTKPDPPAESPPAADNAPAAQPDATKPDPKKDYEDALKRYEEEKSAYDIKHKDYEEKITAGEKRVAELNRRFADWYYVISEDLFDRLKLKREDLVEKKTPPAEKPAELPLQRDDADQETSPPVQENTAAPESVDNSTESPPIPNDTKIPDSEPAEKQDQ